MPRVYCRATGWDARLLSRPCPVRSPSVLPTRTSDRQPTSAIYAPAVRTASPSFELGPARRDGDGGTHAQDTHVVTVARGRLGVTRWWATPTPPATGSAPATAGRWTCRAMWPSHQGQGIGRRLYESCCRSCRLQGFLHAYAGITPPNPASLALHRAIGMTPVGTFERVATSWCTWWSVTWLGVQWCLAAARSARRADPVAGPPCPPAGRAVHSVSSVRPEPGTGRSLAGRPGRRGYMRAPA